MTDKDWALKLKTRFLVWKTRAIENIHLKNAISHSETLPSNCDFVIDLSKHIMNIDKKKHLFFDKNPPNGLYYLYNNNESRLYDKNGRCVSIE